MVAYKNFYETIQEARMRLKGTIVRYKDDFYYVLDIGDHKDDGKFRIYMDKLGAGRVGRDRYTGFPSDHDYGGNTLFKQYDAFIEKHSDTEVTRKFADSRHFEKFRPFPLGNVNQNGSVVYAERSPTRNMHQGLLADAVLGTRVESVPSRYDPNQRKLGMMVSGSAAPLGNAHIDTLGEEFYDMLKGNYPSFTEVVDNLRDPHVLNNGCAFHREYSVMRGPLDTLILCYKHSGVGFINADNTLVLGSTHEFLREELQELGHFPVITVKEVNSYA